METDSVSIIIVNYNVGSMLVDCVELALEQSSQVIIVDNASTDDSIANLESKLVDRSRLTLIRNHRNLGFAAACNIGSKAASGEFLFYLNPDALLHEGTVAKLVSNLKAHPDAGIAGGLLLNPDGTEQGGGRRAVPTPWRSFVRVFGLSRYAHRWPNLFFDYYLYRQPIPDGPVAVESVSGAGLLVRRSVMEQIGYWDSGYFLHCEDLDLCMSCRQLGWKVLFVPDAPVTHFLGLCSRSRPIFVEWNKHKGMMRFYRKFFRHQYPGILMWLVTIGVWFRFCTTALNYTLRQSGQWFGYRPN